MALSTVVTISNQRRDSINKTIFLVVICFIISWLPNFILSLYITFGGISGKILYDIIYIIKVLQIMARKICDISYVPNRPVLHGFIKFVIICNLTN